MAATGTSSDRPTGLPAEVAFAASAETFIATLRVVQSNSHVHCLPAIVADVCSDRAEELLMRQELKGVTQYCEIA